MFNKDHGVGAECRSANNRNMCRHTHADTPANTTTQSQDRGCWFLAKGRGCLHIRVYDACVRQRFALPDIQNAFAMKKFTIIRL
jgi:hypothetical protein